MGQIGGSEIEHYDFDYQDLTYRNEVANPGDSFMTTCMYDKNKGEDGLATVFGPGSEQEMCIDFVGYWARDAISEGNQFCGPDTSGSLALVGAVESFSRQYGAAERKSSSVMNILPEVLDDGIPDYCLDPEGCGAASGCFDSQAVYGACNTATGQMEFTGPYAQCEEAIPCKVCFPESKCANHGDEITITPAPTPAPSAAPTAAPTDASAARVTRATVAMAAVAAAFAMF